MPSLSTIKLFLLDMDGTFYLGDTLLPGAREFLAACRQVGARYTFLTNNSSKSPRDYIEKLAGMGVAVAEDEMYTSGDATIGYLRQNGLGPDVLLVGTASLRAQFQAAGFNPGAPNPGAVVLGFDTALNYATLTALCNAVRAGLPYIATHPDLNCPVPGGFIPDVGAVIAFVQAATGRAPNAVIGKPNAHIAQAVTTRFGLPPGQICMVGDRLYTDIALGAAGVRTALVFCGETTREDYARSDIRADFTFENLAAMAAALLGGAP